MRMKLAIHAAVALTALALPAGLTAHRAWILPSTTQVAGEDSWVTFDAAASTNVFEPDHQPMRVEPSVTAPDGSAAKVQNFMVGRFRATFDVQVNKPGTWKVALVNAGVMGTYMLNGKEERLPRGTRADQLATAVPAGATDVKLSENLSRNEVFLTNGAPTETVFKSTGQGLEFAPVTHPTDLVAGEEATFGFLLDGKPAAGLKVTIARSGMRYRTAQEEQTLTTDAKGQVKVKWPAPGMYWLSTTTEGKSATIPNAGKRMGYTTTLEVLGG